MLGWYQKAGELPGGSLHGQRWSAVQCLELLYHWSHHSKTREETLLFFEMLLHTLRLLKKIIIKPWLQLLYLWQIFLLLCWERWPHRSETVHISQQTNPFLGKSRSWLPPALRPYCLQPQSTQCYSWGGRGVRRQVGRGHRRGDRGARRGCRWGAVKGRGALPGQGGVGRRGPAAILRRTIPAARHGPLRPAGGRGARGQPAGSAHAPPPAAALCNGWGARALSLPPPPPPSPRPLPLPPPAGAQWAVGPRCGGGAGESPAGARTHGARRGPAVVRARSPPPPPPSPLPLSPSSLRRRARSILPPLCEALGASRTPPTSPWPTRSLRWGGRLLAPVLSSLRPSGGGGRPGSRAQARGRGRAAPPLRAIFLRGAGPGGSAAGASWGGRRIPGKGGGGATWAPFPPSSGRGSAGGGCCRCLPPPPPDPAAPRLLPQHPPRSGPAGLGPSWGAGSASALLVLRPPRGLRAPREPRGASASNRKIKPTNPTKAKTHSQETALPGLFFLPFFPPFLHSPSLLFFFFLCAFCFFSFFCF